jgi:magnesium chelatase family protein
MVSRYKKRVSGPLMDRIDIHVEVPAVKYEKLTDDRLGEPSAVVRQRVEAAREIQRRRFAGTTLVCNSDMGPAEIRQFCQVDETGRSLLKATTPALAAQVQVCTSCT